MTSYKGFTAVVLVFGLLISLTSLVMGQGAPTLVPPTLVPSLPIPILDIVPTQSTIARLQSAGRVRVGVLYNEPPFGELTLRGEVRGFDADLARKLAEAWGIEIDFVQVTRTSGIEALKRGEVDMLIAAQVHERSLAREVEFSQPYRVGKQAMMVRNDDEAQTLFNMVNRTVGYVLGTEGQRAIESWQAETGLTLASKDYFTLDKALGGLFAGEVDGVVARQEHLLRVAGNQLFSLKVLDEPVSVEPFAVAISRQDVSFRQLIDRTLQFFIEDGTMETLYSTYFQGQAFQMDTSPVWAGVGDTAPTPNQFSTELRLPQEYVLARIQSTGKVRVAGLFPLPADALDSVRRVDTMNRQVIEMLAQRWGVSVELVEGGDVYELLELGLADIAVGVKLDWAFANRVDYSQPYMLHGDRLMVKTNISVSGFNDLRNKWIGIMNSDEGAQERAQGWADSITARVRFYNTSEANAADAMLVENNADVVYADSLKLLGHLSANSTTLRLTERWYSRNYIGFALPRNDVDFRHLVDYTLQEMQSDGTLGNMLALVIPPNEDKPIFLITPGSDDYYGITLDS